jgi:hypothetical protein
MLFNLLNIIIIKFKILKNNKKRKKKIYFIIEN